MEYQLQIYGPGGAGSQGCIKVFTSAAPFLPLRAGDLLNAAALVTDGSEAKLLRVVNVEHLISDKPGGGIDPSGRTVHRVLVYTETVTDTAETRQHMPAQ